MAEAPITNARSWLQPADAHEFSEWLDEPRRPFLHNLIVKLLIGFAVILTLSWAAAWLHFDVSTSLCLCG